MILFYIITIGCKQTKESELAQTPCVQFDLESSYAILGYYYEAEIFLNCDRPDSLNQISVNAICVSAQDSLEIDRSYRDVEFYTKNNRLFCKYSGVGRGLN